MTVLSAQTIRRLGIVEPFHERTVHEATGMTFGLGPAGYDVRLAQDLDLAPGHFGLVSILEKLTLPDNVLITIHDKSTLARMGLTAQTTVGEPGWFGILTLELTNNHPPYAYQPAAPQWSVRDQASYHRKMMAEEREHRVGKTLRLIAGQPIAQVVFHRLDEPTEQPYRGKYQDQPAQPVPAIFEGKEP